MKCKPHKSDTDDYRVMAVELPWEEIGPDYNDIVSEYGRLPIPGFRAGKVPRQVVEHRFQQQITEDLARRCAQKSGREVLKRSDSEPASPIQVSDIDCSKGKQLRFTAHFLVLPAFDLPDLRSIQIPEKSEDPLSELSHWLLQQVSVRLPDELVRAELAVDGIRTAEPESTDWAAASERVKLMLILKKIARQEGIEVDESDIESRIREKASEFGTTQKALRAQLEKGGGKERLRDLLIAENTLGYLLEI